MSQKKKNWSVFVRYIIFIIIMLIIIGSFVYYITLPLTPQLIAEHKRTQKIQKEIKNLRKTFAYEQNAITYAVSYGLSKSKQIYTQSEKNALQSFDKLKSIIQNKKLLIYLDNLIYNQTMFSEQVSRLFSSIIAKKQVTLTYDEQTDLKAYSLRTLNNAKKYTDNFDFLLNKFDEILNAQERQYDSIVQNIFYNLKSYGLILLGGLLLLAFIITSFFISAKEDELEKLSLLIQESADNHYNNTISFSTSTNSHFVQIIKNFNNLISYSMNLISNFKSTTEDLTHKINTLSTNLIKIIDDEKNKTEINKKNIHNLLEYIQNFENIHFFLKQIELTFETISNSTEQIVVSQNTITTTINTISDENKKIHEQLLSFNETAEKINLLALNINIEATKMGEETKGFGMISNEIRKLISEFLEMSRGFSTLIRHNTQSISDSTKTFKSAQDTIQSIKDQISSIKNNIHSVQEVMQTEANAEKEIEETQDEAIQKNNQILDNLALLHNEFIEIQQTLTTTQKTLNEYEKLEKTINYYETKEIDEIAEKTVFSGEND